MMIDIRMARSERDLKGIKTLCSENHFSKLSDKELNTQGFITINYSLDELKALHEIAASVIALDNQKVVGYALVANKESLGIHHMLDDLIRFIEHTTYQSISFRNSRYIVVGQLCVSKAYRRQKIAQRIYEKFQQIYGNDYHYCITSVDIKNQGSIKAHLMRGFKEIQTTTYQCKSYSVILWDWTESTDTMV